MAGRSASKLVSIFVAGVVVHFLCTTVFVQPGGGHLQTPRVQRPAFEQGKVNLGIDGAVVKSKNMPAPVLEATEATNSAIQECLDEGCSVEALMELDMKLAKDEAVIKKSLDELHSSQAEEYSEEGKEQIAWLSNYLFRSGSLRAQLQAVKTLKAEGDLVSQLVRAASVAFGGGRKGDYPKAWVFIHIVLLVVQCGRAGPGMPRRMYGRASYGASFIRLRFVETRYPRRLKPQKDEDDEDSADETTEEKVKAYGVAWMLKSTVAPSSFASFACRACRIHAGIPLTLLVSVILGIWTPGTQLTLDGVRAAPDSPYRSMGAISRLDDEMDRQRHREAICRMCACHTICTVPTSLALPGKSMRIAGRGSTEAASGEHVCLLFDAQPPFQPLARLLCLACAILGCLESPWHMSTSSVQAPLSKPPWKVSKSGILTPKHRGLP
ncbi:unnamed protein product [Symbiodinium natans]|uniref:Uncharacterized protein n=1 Tax=Symbiodinium natans TaxID=878477 RepID=A0A812PLZ2_9DINO|nr:unnamed protein product [Symbiodinium natans]